MVKSTKILVVACMLVVFATGSASAFFIMDTTGTRRIKSEGANVAFPHAVRMVLPSKNWKVHYNGDATPYPGNVYWGEEVTWTEAMHGIAAQARYFCDISYKDKTVTFTPAEIEEAPKPEPKPIVVKEAPKPVVKEVKKEPLPTKTVIKAEPKKEPVQPKALALNLKSQPVETMECGGPGDEHMIYFNKLTGYHLCRDGVLLPLTEIASFKSTKPDVGESSIPQDKAKKKVKAEKPKKVEVTKKTKEPKPLIVAEKSTKPKAKAVQKKPILLAADNATVSKGESLAASNATAIQKPAPLPKPAPKPLPIFVLKSGSFKEQLKKQAKKAGYTLKWRHSKDIFLDTQVTLQLSFEDFIKVLSKKFEQLGYRYQFNVYKANKMLVVKEF